MGRLKECLKEYEYSNDESNLLFYWLDSHEAAFRRDGKLYLTGRARSAGASGTQSCCLQITSIPHVIYFLPRDNCEMGEVYEEVESIFDAKKIKKFKSRPVEKKNFFAGPSVPAEAEYLRVEYDAQYPALDTRLKGATFSHVFNIGQDLFEFFALERTVKARVRNTWLALFELTNHNPTMGNYILDFVYADWSIQKKKSEAWISNPG